MLTEQTVMPWEEMDVDAVMRLLAYDKKRCDGHSGFVLIKAIEKPLVDQQVEEALVRESLVELLKSLNE